MNPHFGYTILLGVAGLIGIFGVVWLVSQFDKRGGKY